MVNLAAFILSFAALLRQKKDVELHQKSIGGIKCVVYLHGTPMCDIAILFSEGYRSYLALGLTSLVNAGLQACGCA